MRRRTIRYGLRLIISAVMLVIVTTFFHEAVAEALSLSRGAESRLIFLGLVWGALIGCAGIAVSVAGLLGRPDNTAGVNLVRYFLLLAGAIILFFTLFYSSFVSPRPARSHPDDIITI